MIQYSTPISTHTPLAGRDGPAAGRTLHKTGISTHTPLAGRDIQSWCIPLRIGRFLLTRPLRDVTKGLQVFVCCYYISTHTPLAGRDSAREDRIETWLFISTHTPLAGRDMTRGEHDMSITISTHTPLAGRDGLPEKKERRQNNFYSHAPCGT